MPAAARVIVRACSMASCLASCDGNVMVQCSLCARLQHTLLSQHNPSSLRTCLQLRREQRRRVAWTAAEEAVLDSFRQDPAVRYLLERLMPDIVSGELAPRAAAELLTSWHNEYL